MPGFVKMEIEDRLAIVTVNRPDALNALNSTVLRELSMAIEHLSMAADVIYTGDRIDAATAERIGLVNRVVPADRLLAEAKALAHKILEKGPAAIALAKACLRAAWDMPLSAGLDFETAAFGIVGSTQ